MTTSRFPSRRSRVRHAFASSSVMMPSAGFLLIVFLRERADDDPGFVQQREPDTSSME